MCCIENQEKVHIVHIFHIYFTDTLYSLPPHFYFNNNIYYKIIYIIIGKKSVF